MNYVPVVTSVRRVCGGRLNEKYSVIQFDDVVSGKGVQYKYVVGVFSNEDHEPVFFVASEVNAMQKMFGGGSHFMGVFPGDGHYNQGADDAWGDAAKFFPRAMEVVRDAMDPKRGDAPIVLTPVDQETNAQRFDHERMEATFLAMASAKQQLEMPEIPKKVKGCMRGCWLMLIMFLIVVVGLAVALVQFYR